jgi:hypothetical protein
MEASKSRGGARPGAGRKEGYRKPEGVRKNRSIKAYDDEWKIIKQFSSILKKDPEMAKKMLGIEV